MSVFKVKLQNIKQGLMDLDPSTHPAGGGYGQLGSAFSTSLQRQIFVAGPNGTYRLLKDGDQFTDSNYWKRFAVPQVAAEHAFIEVVTDDGSVYSDVDSENVFSVGATETLSTSFADTVVDFVTTHGGPAKFLQIQNLDASIAINGELNGDVNVTFRLNAGETQIFNQGDLVITMLRLKSDSGTPQASYIAGVKSVSNS